MAKTSQKVRAAAPAKYSTRQHNRCKICGRPTRVGHKIDANGKKVRTCKKSDCLAEF